MTVAVRFEAAAWKKGRVTPVAGRWRMAITRSRAECLDQCGRRVKPSAPWWLENPAKIPLELIEMQSGSYPGEDDIVRFEDRYGRA